MRFFNTTGPCNPDRHYMLPPEARFVGAQLHRYVEDQLYWVLHAPRQTGKTTFLQSWMRELNATGNYTACYVSIERTQGIKDRKDGISAICNAIKLFAEWENLPVPDTGNIEPHSMLSYILADWAKLVAPKPLIVLFDEVDVLEEDVLISFLRQLREGFATRGVGKFPISIALVGMRDLKDYIEKSKDGKAVNPGSPFNIKADSAVLGNFSKPDIVSLFAQRTVETGQQIAEDALNYVWEQSYGQPWIVNNLFMRATLRILDETSAETVTLDHAKQARKQMIEARETHLDALSYRMQDPRVRHVIQSIITGNANPPLSSVDDDVMLATDLGLVRYDSIKGFVITNPIYTELLMRFMNLRYQEATPDRSNYKWQKNDGSLDMDSLLREFQKFWRRHSEIWESKSDYTESFPHLLLLAFLQRILNGEGDIDCEVASGRGRMDLFVKYQDYKCVIELKLWRDYDTYDMLLEEALAQTISYRDHFGKEVPAYLLIFDRRNEDKKAAWDERIKWDMKEGVTVFGL